MLLARYVGQVGIISLTTIPVFTYLNGEEDKVRGGPGSDIKVGHEGVGVEVGRGRGWRWDLHWWMSSFWPHQRSRGGEQTATAAPLPLICAWVIRTTWLPLMAPVLSWEVKQGCDGRVHTNTQARCQ